MKRKKCVIKELETNSSNCYVIHIIDKHNHDDPYYVCYAATGSQIIWGSKRNAIIFSSYKEAKETIDKYCHKGKYLAEDVE